MKLSNFRNRYNKLSSRLIGMISLIVVICFSFFTYNVSSSIADAEFLRFEQRTELMTNYIDKEISRVIDRMEDATNYYKIFLMTSPDITEEREDILSGLKTYDDFAKSLFLIKSPQTNSSVEYYSLNTDETLNVLTPDFDVDAVLYQYNNRDLNHTQFLYFDKNTNKLFNISKLSQTTSNKEILLGLEINSTFITNFFNDVNTNMLGNLGLASEDGTIIFHSNKTLIGQSFSSWSLGNEVVNDIKENISHQKQFNQTINGPLGDFELIADDKYTFLYIPIEIETHNTTWGIIVDINDQILKESSIKIAKTIIIGGLLTLLTLVLLIKVTVKHSLKPIDSIMFVMKEIESGHLDARTSIASCNEMEVIGKQLNGLLDHMIDDRHAIVQQKNEIEELLVEVENLMQENDRIYYETIKSLAKTIDAKDPYTGGHCDRVTNYALFIGKELELSTDELSSLTYGAMLHDIGKIGISESIITKEGRLTDEKFDAIKTHPEKGFEILKDIHFLKGARLGVLHHHERYDGRGYPHNLKKDTIDLKARIIAIADAFDAMTSDRSYRKALSKEKAIEQLITNKGLQFDPEMVDIFVRGIQAGHVTL